MAWKRADIRVPQKETFLSHGRQPEVSRFSSFTCLYYIFSLEETISLIFWKTTVLAGKMFTSGFCKRLRNVACLSSVMTQEEATSCSISTRHIKESLLVVANGCVSRKVTTKLNRGRHIRRFRGAMFQV